MSKQNLINLSKVDKGWGGGGYRLKGIADDVIAGWSGNDGWQAVTEGYL